MEIKAILQKPITGGQRLDFVVEYNHNQGYEIRETEEEIQAWGYSEEEIAQQEKERVAKLSLTKREVFLALYRAKGITPNTIKQAITDKEALIEFEYANEYYRGNPLINLIGISLGFTAEELDYLFEFKEFPAKEVLENA